MKIIYKINLFLLIMFSVLFSFFIISNNFYAEEMFDKEEQSYSSNENWGGFPRPERVIFKTTRISKNKYKIYMKIEMGDCWLTFGGTSLKFYINNKLVQDSSKAGYYSYVTYEDEKEVDEANDTLKYRIEYSCSYGHNYNSATFSHTVKPYDNQKPVMQIEKKVTNKKTIRVSATDNRYVSKIYYKIPNSQNFIKHEGSVLTLTAEDDGYYEFKAEDESGNISDIKTVYYDTTAPAINGANTITKENVKIKAEDINFSKLHYIKNNENKVTLENNEITFNEEGIYTVWAEDIVGNVCEAKKVVIDRTKPLIGEYKKYINKTNTVYFNDKYLEKICLKNENNEIVTSLESFIKIPTEKEGKYIIWAEDKAGNKSLEHEIIVDKTAPIVRDYKKYINKDEEIIFNDLYMFKITVTDPQGKIKIYDSTKYIQNTEIDGKWSFYAEDKAGNKSITSYIIVDTKKPVIGLRKANGEILTDGGFNNTGLYFEPNDENYKEIRLYQKNNDLWQEISSSYIAGSIYFDKRESLNLFDTRLGAIEYIFSKEIKKVEEKENWKSDIPGIIPDDQKDVALEGLSYYIYKKDDEAQYIFFEYESLIKFVKKEASSYLQTESREIFNHEGYFKIEAEDKAGNVSFKTFTIDKQIPNGAFVDVINGSITNKKEVIFRFDEENIKVKDNDTQIEPIYESSTKKYVIKITKEGMHNLKLEDKAGNVSTYSVLIDREKIEILNSKNEKLDELFYINNEYMLMFKDSIGIKNIYINKEKQEIKNTRQEKIILKDEKEYFIKAEDKAGNITEFKLIIDKTKPEIIIDGNYSEEENIIYSNEALQFHFYDNKLLKEIKINQENKENNIKIGEKDGRYIVEVTDMAGNVLKKTFIRFKRDEFGNKNVIKNSYKIVSWYNVTLPGYIFNIQGKENISGVYSFKNKDQALKWAIQKEKEYRVQEINIGEWIYVTISNENISQKYKDERLLNEAVEYYAKKYVSEKIYKKQYDEGNIGILINENNEKDDSSFSVNKANTPTFLDEYKDLNIFQINSSFVFLQSKNNYNVKNYTKLEYLADDFKKVDKISILLSQNESIYEGLKRNNNLKQGYYLVEEFDVCLNKEKYLVYIDFEKPKLNAEVLLGNNTRKNINIDEKYIKSNLNTMRYCEFNFKEMLDNIDNNFIILEIKGKNINQKFTKEDNVPTLSFEKGYQGEYIITLYDRSSNTLTMSIYIAGKKPSMEYSSLGPHNQKLFIDFKINDKNNSFSLIEIYKISENGEKKKLMIDSENNEINAGRRSYVLTKGGKYVARLIDLFNREIWTKAIFFQKDLPIGSLSIDNETYTNKNVTFTYSDKFTLKVYEIKNNEKILINNYVEIFDDIKKRYTVTFFAKPNTDKITYILNLSDKNDSSLYIEYTFGIDTLIGEVKIIEKETDNILMKGNATNKGFKIEFDESDLEIKYSLSGNTFKTYKKDEILDQNGIYHIKVVDYVGNKEEFDIYVDSKVDFTIKGNFKYVNNKYLSKDNLELVLKEQVSNFEVKLNKKVINMKIGEIFSEDGEYEVKITDKYKNEIKITILIDKTAPIINIKGVNEKNITKDKVTISSDKENKLELYKKHTFIKNISEKEEIEEEGEYRVIATDMVGNITEKTFIIDKSINIKLNILNYSFTSDTVYLSAFEDLKIDIKKDNKKLDGSIKTFKEIGKYEINLEDSIGNKKIINFTIIPKGSNEVKLELYKNTKIVNIKKNGIIIDKKDTLFKENGKYEILIQNDKKEYILNFFIDSIKPELDIKQSRKGVKIKRTIKENSKIKLYKNGKLQENFSTSSLIKEPGKYTVWTEDEFGNKNSYNFEVKKHINIYGLIGISIVLIIILGGVIYGIISKRIKSH